MRLCNRPLGSIAVTLISLLALPVSAQTSGPSNDSSTSTQRTTQSSSTTSSPATASSSSQSTRTSSTSQTATPAPRGDRSYFFYAGGGVGPAYADIIALSQSNFYPQLVRTNGWGTRGMLVAGFHVLAFSIGARLTFGTFDAFDLGTVGADVALRIPLGGFHLFIRSHLGFAWQGRLNDKSPELSQTNVVGWEVGAGLGFDIMLAEVISLGLDVGADFLNLSRQSINLSGPGPTDVDLTKSGNAVGVAGHVMVTLKLQL